MTTADDAPTIADQIRRRLQLESTFGIRYVRQRPGRLAQIVRDMPDAPADSTPPAPVGDDDDEDAAEPAPPASMPVSAPDSGSVDRDAVLAELDELRREVAACRACQALVGRTQTVFSDGTPFTPLMFVGEAPGYDEDRTGTPFVGKAGQKLTEIIEKGLGKAAKDLLGLDHMPTVPRESVYIANVLKCRPPANRDPLPDEVANCRDFLHRQIRLVNPSVIVALGRPAAHRLTGQQQSMAQMRGKRYELAELPGVIIIPTYHPSYVLRNYTMTTRKRVMDDITEAMRVLHELGKVPWWESA